MSHCPAFPNCGCSSQQGCQLPESVRAQSARVLARCCYCGSEFSIQRGQYNRAKKIGANLYCNRKCAGLARRKQVSLEQKKAVKAEYDRKYRKRDVEFMRAKKAEYYQRTRDPEKERAIRKANMPRHLEYCRRPEYRAQKHEYDIQRASAAYGPFAAAWRILLDIEKEIRSRMSKYERLKARDYYSHSATQRRRELWRIKNQLNSLRLT